MTPEEIPAELIQILDQRAGKEHSRTGSVVSCLAEILTRWEQIRPHVCPYDCDNCHDESCPCERLGCAGFQELACTPQECPPFQEMNLDVQRVWFGQEHGWLTYDEAVAKGF